MPRTIIVVYLLSIASGCTSSRIHAPPNYAVVPPSVRGRFDERAITADGIVLASRHFANPENATPAFWTNAITDRMRDAGGYTLLGSEAIRSSSGHEGTLIRFTRPYSDQTFSYWIAVFTNGPDLWGNRNVFVVEAGGPEQQFTRDESSLRQAFLDFNAN